MIYQLCLAALLLLAILSSCASPPPTSLPTLPPSPSQQPPTLAPATRTPPLPPSPMPVATDTHLPTTATSKLPSAFPTTEGMTPARVIRVVDGDTIEVLIDGQSYELRYIGINTPEHGFPYFQESTDANRALVEGQQVMLEKDVSERDRYGRLLRYVYLTNGLFVNGELVARGFSESIAYPPDTKHQDELDALKAQAQAQGLGMWRPAPPLEPMNLIIDPSCSQFNSPGDDNYSKEEEYVCITNQGLAAVDITRWWLRDEAGASYYFPAFTLDPGASVRVRTGCGQDTSSDLYWCRSGSAVWNNGGDKAYLYNAQDALVDQLTY
jgi:endonuclease YncB( thermonuclease family)